MDIFENSSRQWTKRKNVKVGTLSEWVQIVKVLI